MVTIASGGTLSAATYVRSADIGGGLYLIDHTSQGRILCVTDDDYYVRGGYVKAQIAIGETATASTYSRVEVSTGIFAVALNISGRVLDVDFVYRVWESLEWNVIGAAVVTFVGNWIGQQDIEADDWNVHGASDVQWNLAPILTAMFTVAGVSNVLFEGKQSSMWNVEGASTVSFGTGSAAHVVNDWNIDGRANVFFDGILRDIIHWNVDGVSQVWWLMPLGDDIGGDGTVPGGGGAGPVNIAR